MINNIHRLFGSILKDCNKIMITGLFVGGIGSGALLAGELSSDYGNFWYALVWLGVALTFAAEILEKRIEKQQVVTV